MSYLHPAYYKLLPATARPQLIAYLQLVERNVHASRDGWADVRQAVIAGELGRSARSVRLYEAVCVRAGVLEVEHGRAHNRRRVRLVSARRATAANPNPTSKPIRECGNGLPHSAATGRRTVDNSHPLPRARSDRGDLLRSQTPEPAAPAERASPSPARPGRAAAPLRAEATKAAAAELVAELDLGARWVRPVAELAVQLVERSDDRQAAGYLRIVRERCSRNVQPYARAKAVLAMLNARLRKLREHEAPRTRS